MRILFLIGTNDLCDGIARHILTLAENFSGGVDVGVCITQSPGELGSALSRTGAQVLSLDCAHGHDLRILPRFRQVLSQFRPDVVHAHVPALACQLWLAMCRRDLPVVQTFHGIPSPASHGGAAIGQFKKAGESLAQAIYSRTVRQYLAVSGPTRTWHIARGVSARSIRTVYNPVSLKGIPPRDGRRVRGELGLSDHVRLVGMVGRLAAVKDWPSFLGICRCVADRTPDVAFVAVGDGPLLGPMQTAATTVGLSGRLHWLGYRADALLMLAALDVSLITSHNEGMPTVLLESFAVQTPVAGFIPVGGVEEVMAYEEESGGPLARLTRSRDCHVAADAVMWLVDHPADATAQAGRALDLVRRRFDAKVVCAELETIYREVVSGARAGGKGTSHA